MTADVLPVSNWSLAFDDLTFLSEFPEESRLGFAAQLVSFRTRGRFIDGWGELDPEVIGYLGDQVNNKVGTGEAYDFQNRSARRHKLLIVARLSRDSFLIPRIFCTFAVSVLDSIVDRSFQLIGVAECLVGKLGLFEDLPHQFDVVEFRRVFWQPFDC